MRRILLALLVVAVAAGTEAALPLAQALREELRIQERLLSLNLSELQQQEEQIRAAWDRVDRQGEDLIRAEVQEESLDSLRLREADLRQAEAELEMHIHQAQQLRRELISLRVRFEEVLSEVRRLESTVGEAEDPLSGPWRIVIEPGGQEGYMSLELDGTLVQGTYQLTGGWTGSFRGTFVAGKVRLERIDSQMGFATILYARLVGSGVGARMEGTWDATQLASGLPSAGSWIAERVQELPPP